MNLVRTTPPGDVEREERGPIIPKRSEWFRLTCEQVDRGEDAPGEYRGEFTEETVLGCVTNVGSNFVELAFRPEPHYDNKTRQPHRRFALEDAETWERSDEAMTRAYLNRGIGAAQQEVRELMARVHETVAKLGITTAGALDDGLKSETSALAARQDDALPKYRKALAKAEKKTLPELFAKLKEAHGMAAGWMKFELAPLSASIDGLDVLERKLKKRIFNVEVYAGLTEDLKLINEGAARADESEPIHVFQRRLYMDEEFIAAWSSGGADIRDLAGFSEWLAEPTNLKQLLPFPRCIAAFKVRRKEKREYLKDLLFEPLDVMSSVALGEENKRTLLFCRNGNQLWRLFAPIEFPEELFPDPKSLVFLNTKEEVLVRLSGGTTRFITRSAFEEERQATYASRLGNYVSSLRKYHRIWWKARRAQRLGLPLAQVETLPGWHFRGGKLEKRVVETFEEEREHWGRRNTFPYGDWSLSLRDVADEIASHIEDFDPSQWRPFNPNDLRFDEARKELNDLAERHNRIVFLLQGLLDRSEIFHPHPPWQLYRDDGFANGLRLHLDGTRAIPDGPPPSIDAYFAKNRTSFKVGDYVFGPRIAWLIRNAERALARGRRHYADYELNRAYEGRLSGVYGDPGPRLIERIIRIRGRQALFTWKRKAQKQPTWYRGHPRPATKYIDDSIWVPLDQLFNVTNYVPGDMKPFFTDPRTRAEYMRWGQLFVESEKFHVNGPEEREEHDD